MRRTAAFDTLRADGCALNTTALPAEMIEMALLMTVAAGFVTGEIEPTTPNGANSVIVIPPAPDTASTSRSSGPGVLRGAQAVLDRLVVDASQARLFHGEPCEGLGLVERRAADGRDDHLASVEVERAARRRLGRGDRLVQGGEHAVAQPARGRRLQLRAHRRLAGEQRLSGLADAPAGPFDDVLDLALVDHVTCDRPPSRRLPRCRRWP